MENVHKNIKKCRSVKKIDEQIICQENAARFSIPFTLSSFIFYFLNRFSLTNEIAIVRFRFRFLIHEHTNQSNRYLHWSITINGEKPSAQFDMYPSPIWYVPRLTFIPDYFTAYASRTQHTRHSRGELTLHFIQDSSTAIDNPIRWISC